MFQCLILNFEWKATYNAAINVWVIKRGCSTLRTCLVRFFRCSIASWQLSAVWHGSDLIRKASSELNLFLSFSNRLLSFKSYFMYHQLLHSEILRSVRRFSEDGMKYPYLFQNTRHHVLEGNKCILNQSIASWQNSYL
jgi:hypothetical protein